MSRDSIEKPENRSTSSPTHIVILGSGFAGIEVLKKLQKKFDTDDSVEITLISKDNFILFTPMLPEVASGMIETRNIVTPVRSFCKKAKFYEAKVESIDLDNKQLTLTHAIGRQSQPNDWHEHIVKYDYVVIALGSENNFFKMSDVQRCSFTMKSINDAIVLRNHIINVLEQASLEEDNIELRKSLLTFVVAGGGFNGVESVGAINDFIRDRYKCVLVNMTESIGL
jgi:NADH dehydrogenase